MRALVVLALLAGIARADPYEPTAKADPVDELSSDPAELMRLLERTLSRGSSPRCEIVLAKLARLGARDGLIAYSLGGGALPRGRHELPALRRRCAEDRAAREVSRMKAVIARAMEFPWEWAERCVAEWPLALDRGVNPRTHVEIAARSRRDRRYLWVSGTLEELALKYCDNAYTPRRRGE